mgnify:CR=1 FL=1
MNVTINIYGDVHIHCDCCDGCGEYDDNFDDVLEVPHEAAPDAEAATPPPPPKKRKRR